MKRKHLIGGMIISAVMMLYGVVQSFGAEPLSTDLITRFELDHYADSQESQRELMLDQALKSTVLITTSLNGKGGSGSGFFISPNTLITNRHVVKGVDSVKIRTIDGNICEPLMTIIDNNNDVAVIKTNCTMPYLEVNYKQRIGQDVYAIGNPDNLEFSVSRGILSAIRPQWLQFDALTNYGSSGGPLMNSKGEVIGIVSAKTADERNWIGLAQPISIAKYEINLALEKEVKHG